MKVAGLGFHADSLSQRCPSEHTHYEVPHAQEHDHDDHPHDPHR
jgi:hypothetical protein